MPFAPPTDHCQTKGFSIIGDIILERIDCCFGNKVECGVPMINRLPGDPRNATCCALLALKVPEKIRILGKS